MAEKIFFNENITTENDSVIVIQFRDGSTFEIGANGSAVIDELAFNPAEGTSIKVVTLTQGTFRYISGFIAKKSSMVLNTPNGAIGIRGSAVSGVIQPNVPTFFHVSSGSATFTNDAGSSSINEGQSMAAPSRTTPPMRPERMPPAVTAQVLQQVQATLGTPPAAQALSPEQRAADAVANAVSVTLQQSTQSQAARLTPATVATTATPPAGLSLLTQAANVGLLSASTATVPTAAQRAFIAAAQTTVPNAVAIISTASAQDKQQNKANTAAGTATVITGASENAQSADQISAIIQSAVGANPSAAGAIAASATVGAASNNAVSATDAAQAVTSGAVQGAVGAGADVNAITQAVAGGVVAGTVQTGGNVAEVVAAASDGAVRAAASANIDVSGVARASSAGMVSAAGNAGLDVAAVGVASQLGAVSAAGDVGADVSTVIASTTEVVAAAGGSTNDTAAFEAASGPDTNTIESVPEPEIENPNQNASPN
ncbi:MAG: FecR domain-containing protein [Rhodospirillales bacterium]|nr:FecR domain-containing protein [Rhodospirillales bacterium]